MKKKVLCVLLVAVCVLSMAACGSKKEDSSAGDAGDSGKKEKLVMATNAEFEPYEYHEGDGIVGIDVDLSRAICDKMGYDLEILDMEFDSILPSIAAGKADFGAAGMTVDA